MNTDILGFLPFPSPFPLTTTPVIRVVQSVVNPVKGFRVAEGSPSLETFKTQLDKVLSNLI